MNTIELIIFSIWLIGATGVAWRWYWKYANKIMFYMTRFDAVAIVVIDIACAAMVGAIWPLLAVIKLLEAAETFYRGLK